MGTFDQFNTKAFLDTNIILECRELADLPWEEVDPEGPILVLVTARVAQEVDMRKRDGRLAPRARAFNKIMGEAVVSGQPVPIRQTAPRVELTRSVAGRIPWSDHDDLDPEEADHRIIAEVLHAKGIEDAEKVVISHDVNPLGLARDHGLRVHHVGDHWLRSPEPSPMEKEVQRLKGRLAVLEATQPEFDISIDVDSERPVSLLQVEAMDEASQATWLRSLIRANPKPPNGSNGTVIDPLRDYGFDDTWRRYVGGTLPRFVANLPSRAQVMFNQRQFRVRVRNAGVLQAEDLTIEVATTDGWLNENYVFVSPTGPIAPTPRNMMDLHSPYLGRLSPAIVGRHEFQWLEEPEECGRFRVACAAFASEAEWQFDGVIMLDSDIEAPTVVSVRVRAANLKGAASSELVLEKAFERSPVAAVAVPGDPKWTRTPAVFPLILQAWREKNYDKVQLRSREED